jgi:hypothetical protein
MLSFHNLIQEKMTQAVCLLCLGILSVSPLSEAAPRIEVSLSRSANLQSESSRDAERSMDLEILAATPLSEKWTGSLSAALTKQESGPKDTLISDLSAGFRNLFWQASESWSLAALLTAIFPASRASVERDRLQGAGTAAVRASRKFSWIDVSYQLGWRQNVHEFEVNRDFSPNIQSVLSHRVLLGVPLFSQLSFSGDYIYRQARTYGGFDRQNFTFYSSLSWAATPNFQVFLGTTNEGPAFKANGSDSNLAFFTENTSSISGGITYVF